MKKIVITLAATAAALFAVCTTNMTVNAATIDDVVATAKRYGIPEDTIQQGCNEYYANPDKYTPQSLDKAIEYIINTGNEIIEPLITTAAGNTQPITTTQTVSPSNESSSNENITSETNKTQDTTSPTLETPFERVDEKDFINMTYEQKQEYIASIPDDKKQDFVNSLSPAEYNSILKQLPTDKKLQVIDGFSKAGDEMGMNISVDEITDDSVAMSIRNDNGQLIGVASAGVIVEDTGYDYRLLFSISGILILSALAGIWFLIKKFFKDSDAENSSIK